MRNIRKVIFVEPRGESPNVYSGILIPRTGAVLLATLLRENGYESKGFCEEIAPAIMGGTHATFMPDEALDRVDFVVTGEGEGPLVELLAALEGRGSFAGIPNLSY